MKTDTQSIPLTLLATQSELESILKKYLDDQIERAQAVDASYQELWQMTAKVVLAGGKRLRPYLLCQSYIGFGKNDTAIMQVAAAWELLHVFMLIHDDIIDRDYIRHGQPNVAGLLLEKYTKTSTGIKNARHYADGGAMIAGDLLLSACYDLINSCDLSGSQKQLANQQLNQAMYMVAAGEFLDTEAVLSSLPDANPLKIADLKTASYSFVSPLLTGARLAGATKEDQQQLELFGKTVGVAYQLVDDLLGVFGSEERLGKPIDSDLQEAKRTLLLKQTYELANPEQKKQIDHLIEQIPLKSDQVTALRTIIVESGAKEKAIEQIDAYRQKAITILEQLKIQDEVRQNLLWLVKFALDREY